MKVGIAFDIPEISARELHQHLKENIKTCLIPLDAVAQFDIVKLGHKRMVLSIDVIEGGEAAYSKIFDHFKHRGLKPQRLP